MPGMAWSKAQLVLWCNVVGRGLDRDACFTANRSSRGPLLGNQGAAPNHGLPQRVGTSTLWVLVPTRWVWLLLAQLVALELPL